MRKFKVSKEIYTDRNDNINRYFDDVNKIPDLSADEEHEIAKLSKQGCEKSRNKLIKSNLKFAISVAKAYQNSNSLLNLNDLINEANLGLVEASETFEPEYGFKFISFAVWHIRRRIQESLSNNSRTIRIPINKINLLGKIGNMQINFVNEHGRMPTTGEIQKFVFELDIDSKPSKIDINKLLNSGNMLIRLESNDPNDEYSPINYINSKIDSYSNIKENDSNTILNKLFEKLNPREKEIVSMRLGIGEYNEEHTYTKIGEGLWMTGENVRIIYIKALKKMKVNNLSFVKRLKNEL